MRFLRIKEFLAVICTKDEARAEGTVIGGVGGGRDGSGFENLLRPPRFGSKVSAARTAASLERMMESGRGAEVVEELSE